MTEALDDMLCSTTDDLAIVLGGSGTSFTGLLLVLAQKADPGNLCRLRGAFPREITMWELWGRMDPLPTFRQVREALETLVEPVFTADRDTARTILFRALADKDTEIARLHAELDNLREAPVELVTEAGLQHAMAADPDREDGSVLRRTDGEKRAYQWKAKTGEWARIT